MSLSPPIKMNNPVPWHFHPSVLWGLGGVLCFSLTLPVTRLISADFHPVFIGIGRCVLAAIMALTLLLIDRASLPSPTQLWRLGVMATGVVFGFPILSALAMTTVTASHGGVIVALFPMGTALAATIIASERPSRQFWLCCILASTLVLGFSLQSASGSLKMGDWALLLSLPLASIGYAMGGHLAKSLGGWRVICWALVLSLPITLPLSAIFAPEHWREIPASSWSGFIYLALFSQLFGFFLWNRGLAMGGIAKVSQLQLLQPFMTLLAAAVLLSEGIGLSTIVVCIAVMFLVYLGRR